MSRIALRVVAGSEDAEWLSRFEYMVSSVRNNGGGIHTLLLSEDVVVTLCNISDIVIERHAEADGRHDAASLLILFSGLAGSNPFAAITISYSPEACDMGITELYQPMSTS